MIVADTDVLIDFHAGAEPAARRVGLELQGRLIAELLAAVPCLPLDEAAAVRAAEVRRALVSGGIDIGMGDGLVAGIVLAHRGILLTRNRRHFERVPNLSLDTA